MRSFEIMKMRESRARDESNWRAGRGNVSGTSEMQAGIHTCAGAVTRRDDDGGNIGADVCTGVLAIEVAGVSGAVRCVGAVLDAVDDARW